MLLSSSHSRTRFVTVFPPSDEHARCPSFLWIVCSSYLVKKVCVPLCIATCAYVMCNQSQSSLVPLFTLSEHTHEGAF